MWGYFALRVFEFALGSVKFMEFAIKGLNLEGSTILLGDVFFANDCCF